MSTRRARNRPSRVERHLGRGDVVAALRVADEMLGAVGLPAHGAPQTPRRLENERIFAIDEALGSEPAADVLGDDAQLVRRNLQDAFGDEIAQAMRALAADVRGQAVRLGVIFGERAARLQEIGDDARIDDFDADDMRPRRRTPRRSLGLSPICVS